MIVEYSEECTIAQRLQLLMLNDLIRIDKGVFKFSWDAERVRLRATATARGHAYSTPTHSATLLCKSISSILVVISVNLRYSIRWVCVSFSCMAQALNSI
jgi:hypothetical protein